MICVYKSNSGQWVLTHPESESVVLGDDFESTYEQMREHLATHHPGMESASPAHRLTTGSGGTRTGESARAWPPSRLLLAGLILLPFLWLSILHLSLGSLLSEVRLGAISHPSEMSHGDVSAELDALRSQINELSLLKAEPDDEEPSDRRRRQRHKRKRGKDAGPDTDPDTAPDTKDADDSEKAEPSNDAKAEEPVLQ